MALVSNPTARKWLGLPIMEHNHNEEDVTALYCVCCDGITEDGETVTPYELVFQQEVNEQYEDENGELVVQGIRFDAAEVLKLDRQAYEERLNTWLDDKIMNHYVKGNCSYCEQFAV